MKNKRKLILAKIRELEKQARVIGKNDNPDTIQSKKYKKIIEKIEELEGAL